LSYVQSLYSELYEAKPGFSIEKLGVAGVYPCPKVLVIALCDIPHARDETSMVVWL
jgi:hypothetical protein